MQTVNYAIIHKLIKETHAMPSVIERNSLLPLTDPVIKLVTDIHDLYAGRASKGYGRFETDETNYPSAKILRSFFKDNEITFVEASKKLLSVLATKTSTVQLATGGYVLMAQITNSNKASWFIVAIINNVDASAIKDDSLEVVDSIHVDLENLRVAGRVNLSDWLEGHVDSRYVGFLKQHGDVAEYFKLFLGCNELVKDTEETRKLVTALKDFSKRQKLDRDEEEEFLRAAHDYCHKHYKDDKPLSLDALANAIWPTGPKKLQKALVTADVQICDGFVPDGRVIRSFVKIKAKTQYWSVDLDRHAFISGDARYNKGRGELVLRNLPAELRAELDSEMSDGK